MFIWVSGFWGQAAAPAANVSGGAGVGSRSTCRVVNTTDGLWEIGGRRAAATAL